MSIVSLMDTQDGRNDHAGPRQRTHVCVLASGREWADTDDKTDVNSAELQGFERSQLEALTAGIDDFSSDLSSAFTQESSTSENAAMELSTVPEALVTIRAG